MTQSGEALRVLDPGLSCDDYVKRTVRRIPTAFGRLVHLASLRQPQSEHYHHDILAHFYSEEEIDRSLRRRHFGAFLEWLCLSLERQKIDLEECLSDTDAGECAALRLWLHLRLYDSLIPASATHTERELFLDDLQWLLPLVTAELNV